MTAKRAQYDQTNKKKLKMNTSLWYLIPMLKNAKRTIAILGVW